MVPTGLEEDSNKYNEYIILETNDGSRFVEQVGSWEVNLDDYVKRQELNNYVQKDGSARLMTEAEAIKLNSVAENAEENYIKEVSTDFNVVDGKLNLKDGYQLLATTDKQKLDALQINGENLQISGKINTAQIIDLELWLNEHASKWVGLSENNFTTPLKDTLEKLLLIEGIDETQLGLQENNILYVKQITTNQISDLNNLAKASDVTNLQTALNGYQASANKRLDDIEAQLTWQPIGND